jgi:hypothetical protein
MTKSGSVSLPRTSRKANGLDDEQQKREREKAQLLKQRIFIVAFFGLALVLAATAIFGGLSSYQKLYEAGHGDSLMGPAAIPSPAPTAQ